MSLLLLYNLVLMKMVEKKVGIVLDEDFASKHIPPYPKPTFIAFETPLRIREVLDYFDRVNLFDDKRLIKISPKEIEEDVLELAHSKYNIESIKRLSQKGGGFIGDEVFISSDTFELAKKAVGGAIIAIESVLDKKCSQSFALIRPPGHHAIRENASGLCIFNNIATSILYLREKLNYKKKIAIIDIDDHFGDGLCQYFYEDPSVLYFSTHEFDFIDGDIGDIDELGEDKGLGYNINFPVPANITDDLFLEFMEIAEPILREFKPEIIIVAAGFDMYFADPIGNCMLTSLSYYNFTERILKIAEDICGGRLSFILEGGYSLIGLPRCIHSVIRGLLKEEYIRPDFEKIGPYQPPKKTHLIKIKEELKKALKPYWTL